MKAGDVVIFRKNGEVELKIGNLAIGNLGMPYIIGLDESVYGLSLLNMIQVYPYEQNIWVGHSNGNDNLHQKAVCVCC